jgi:hypothetical protein
MTAEEALQARVDKLNEQLISLSDTVVSLSDRLAERPTKGEVAERARVAYRQGYEAGYRTGRQGRPKNDNPDQAVRGELRELLTEVA